MKIAIIVAIYLFIILIYSLLLRIVCSIEAINSVKIVDIKSKIEYDEQKIISHLKYIVDEAISDYMVYTIIPSRTNYINSNTEIEMIDKVSSAVQERIPDSLIESIAMIYNDDYVSTFIGNFTYMTIADYILNFNIENGNEKTE